MTLPPSALAVLDVLQARGPLTHKQLVEATPIPARTVRFALSRLKEAGKVEERHSFRDSRQSYYRIPAVPAADAPHTLAAGGAIAA